MGAHVFLGTNCGEVRWDKVALPYSLGDVEFGHALRRSLFLPLLVLLVALPLALVPSQLILELSVTNETQIGRASCRERV